jgi:hypothetical protein
MRRRDLRRAGADVATPDRGDLVKDNDRPFAEQGRTGTPGEPSLRAAVLALGIGLLWAVLSRGRRRRPTDLW